MVVESDGIIQMVKVLRYYSEILFVNIFAQIF
jgi:hypothetical protein